jgi:SusD/RagB-like outer membrane lipoprotein
MKGKIHMRIHRRIIARAIVPGLFAIALAGCESFLDVNNNPNAPEAARIDIRLPALIAGHSHAVYYGETQLWGSEWTQQFSYNRTTRSYAEVHRYELQDTDGSTAWQYFYAGPLNEAYTLMRDAADETDVVYRGLGKFYYAWIFAHITDMWGPIPFTDTFDPRILEPKYEEQKIVYEAVHKLLGEAITDMSSATGRRPTNNDLLFNGDMTRWVKLARYVQARHHLRLAYAPGEDKIARAQSALTAIAQAFVSNADDADFIYPGGDNARNPLWTFQQLQGQLVASEHLVEMLKSREDPRLPILVRPIFYDSIRGTVRYPAAANTFRGHRNGAGSENDSTVSWIGPYFSNENANLSIASYADQKFTEAEARLIVSGAAAADAPYRDGIRANMQKLGIATAAINTYVAARPSLASVPNALEEIIQEKYVANYLKVEPWNDWRRTGFPRLTVVEGAVLPGIPQRVRTPGSELTNNINQVRATGIPTGLEGMSVKVWWASQGPR